MWLHLYGTTPAVVHELTDPHSVSRSSVLARFATHDRHRTHCYSHNVSFGLGGLHLPWSFLVTLHFPNLCCFHSVIPLKKIPEGTRQKLPPFRSHELNDLAQCRLAGTFGTQWTILAHGRTKLSSNARMEGKAREVVMSWLDCHRPGAMWGTSQSKTEKEERALEAVRRTRLKMALFFHG